MRNSWIILSFTALFVYCGCAALVGTETSFQQWRGSKIYQGDGGAVETVDGIEFWSAGEPDRPYRIVGYITQSRSDDPLDKIILGTFNRHEIIGYVKNNGGDGVISVGSSRYVSGYKEDTPPMDKEFNTIPRSISTEYSVSSKLVVFKYVDQY